MAFRPAEFVVASFLALVVAATATAGCDSGGGGSAPAIGSACAAGDSGVERCNGTMNLQCEAQGDGYAWALKKDCADTGRVCSDGDCVAASGGAGGDVSSGEPDAASVGGCAYESHLVVSDGEGSTDMGWGWHCDADDAPSTCTDDQQSSESCSLGTCYHRSARGARWVDDCEAFLANPPET
jgi:hypothetical protein